MGSMELECSDAKRDETFRRRDGEAIGRWSRATGERRLNWGEPRGAADHGQRRPHIAALRREGGGQRLADAMIGAGAERRFWTRVRMARFRCGRVLHFGAGEEAFKTHGRAGDERCENSKTQDAADHDGDEPV